MAILTIPELKALWINGFVPTEDNYADLFESLEALGGSVNETSQRLLITKGIFDIIDNGDGTYSVDLGVVVDDFINIVYRSTNSIPYTISEKINTDFFDYLQQNSGTASFDNSSGNTVMTISGFNPAAGLGSSFTVDFLVTIQEEGVQPE